jgi:hypothetical protein
LFQKEFRENRCDLFYDSNVSKFVCTEWGNATKILFSGPRFQHLTSHLWWIKEATSKNWWLYIEGWAHSKSGEKRSPAQLVGNTLIKCWLSSYSSSTWLTGLSNNTKAIHIYTHTHTHSFIPWILKFVMATIWCGLSHKDTKLTHKCSNNKTKQNRNNHRQILFSEYCKDNPKKFWQSIHILYKVHTTNSRKKIAHIMSHFWTLRIRQQNKRSEYLTIFLMLL